MPITQDLGFVIEHTAAQNPGSPAPAVGYFVVKRHEGWWRLDPIPQVARLRWPLRSGRKTRWIPVTAGFGFVVEEPTGQARRIPVPAAFGYFVAKRSGHGVRLDPMAQGALFDGPATASGPGTLLAITANLRFVIQRRTSAPGGAYLGSALGYFVVRQDGQSLRLNPIGTGQLLRQPL